MAIGQILLQDLVHALVGYVSTLPGESMKDLAQPLIETLKLIRKTFPGEWRLEQEYRGFSVCFESEGSMSKAPKPSAPTTSAP